VLILFYVVDTIELSNIIFNIIIKDY